MCVLSASYCICMNVSVLNCLKSKNFKKKIKNNSWNLTYKYRRMFEIIHTPHSISLIFFHIVAAYSLLQYGSQVEFELSNLHRLIQRPISTSSPHSCWCGGGLLRWYLSHNGISLINRHQNDVLSITILSLHNLYFHTHILCIHTVFPLIFLLPPPLKLLPH